MGGELAQPSNEVDSLTLFSAIANFSLDTTATYWIGDHFGLIIIKLIYCLYEQEWQLIVNYSFNWESDIIYNTIIIWVRKKREVV